MNGWRGSRGLGTMSYALKGVRTRSERRLCGGVDRNPMVNKQSQLSVALRVTAKNRMSEGNTATLEASKSAKCPCIQRVKGGPNGNGEVESAGNGARVVSGVGARRREHN